MKPALQVRYRYELAPLSEFFAVYSRGGFAAGSEADEGLGTLWSQALDDTTADQFALKLRYRFSVARRGAATDGVLSSRWRRPRLHSGVHPGSPA